MGPGLWSLDGRDCRRSGLLGETPREIERLLRDCTSREARTADSRVEYKASIQVLSTSSGDGKPPSGTVQTIPKVPTQRRLQRHSSLDMLQANRSGGVMASDTDEPFLGRRAAGGNRLDHQTLRAAEYSAQAHDAHEGQYCRYPRTVLCAFSTLSLGPPNNVSREVQSRSAGRTSNVISPRPLPGCRHSSSG